MGIQQVVGSTKSWSVKVIKVKASAARVAGDLVKISTGDPLGVPVDATASGSAVYQVGVALESAASGDIYECAVEGTVTLTVPSATYTAGHGLKVAGGIADTGAAAQIYAVGLNTNLDFGIVVVGGTSVTSITATLFGYATTNT